MGGATDEKILRTHLQYPRIDPTALLAEGNPSELGEQRSAGASIAVLWMNPVFNDLVEAEGINSLRTRRTRGSSTYEDGGFAKVGRETEAVLLARIATDRFSYRKKRSRMRRYQP
jgi:hypothetical protein